jgi:hypothetical protein
MTVSSSNIISDPTASLQQFDLLDLQQYTSEKVYSSNASHDFHLFYVGRDDVHNILKHILSRVTTSLMLNMFGYDDDELNDILMTHATDPNITMLITLDKSQSGGVHERKLIELDKQKDLVAFNTHFTLGQSASHQISHTKGFVADGRVAAEGSTNWSDSGEGTKLNYAQNNTQSVITDPDTIARFTAELIAEHMIAQAQQNKSKVTT